MPPPTKRRLVAIGLPGALLCAGVPGAQARDLVRLSRTAWGCFNPSIAAIINDPANPGQSDPAWVAKTREMGDCVTITPRSVWERLTADRDGFTYVAYRGTMAKPGSFWVPTGALVPAPPEPAASAPVQVAVQPLPAPPVQEARPEASPPEPAPPPVQEPQTQQAVVPPPVALPDSAPAAVAPAPQGGGSGGGFWLWVLLLGGGFWALTRRGRKKRKAAAAKASAATSRVPPRVAPTPVRPTSPVAPKQAARPASPPAWCPPGHAVPVAGYRIADGMIYVGSVSGRSGFQDGCVIDPSLGIAPSGTWGKLGYWPSYAGMRPEGRRGYLEWLASGKRAPDADVGFVFLYFYGLERRLFLEKPTDAEVDRIASEVERLRQIYARNASFDGYSRRFLEAAALIRGAAFLTPDMLRPQPGPMSPAMKIVVGREIVAGRPLDGRLASAVLLGLPDFRPNSRLVLEQGLHAFLAVLETRFRAAFPTGLLVRNRKDSRLALDYRGAMSGLVVDLGARAGLEGLPDPATLTWTKLLALGDAVAGDVEPYAKMLAFHPEQADSLAALALCPPELHGTVATEGRRWLAALAPGAGIPFGELARHAIGTTDAKWTLRHRRQVAEVLEAGGLGMEPGPEDSIAPLVDETIVHVFPSSGAPSRAMTIASAAAMLVVALGRGGTRSPEAVEETWLGRLPSRLRLTPEETARLRARLTWSRDAAFSLAKVRNALGEAQPEENELCAWSAAIAAGASGTVDKSKIALLEKICDALQVPRGSAYSWLHADLANATAPTDEPVEVAGGVGGIDIPIRRPPVTLSPVSYGVETSLGVADEVDSIPALQQEEVTHQPTIAASGRAAIIALLTARSKRVAETDGGVAFADLGRTTIVRLLADRGIPAPDETFRPADLGHAEATSVQSRDIDKGADQPAVIPGILEDAPRHNAPPNPTSVVGEQDTQTTLSALFARAQADSERRDRVREEAVRVSAIYSSTSESVEDEATTPSSPPDKPADAKQAFLPAVEPTAAQRAEEDRIRRERIRAETAQVSAVLAEVFQEEVAVSPAVVEEPEAGSYPGLDAAHSVLVRRLAERTHWSRSDYEETARALDLMPDGAMEAINEWAWETFDEPLIDDADPVLVRTDLLPDDPGVAEAAE